MFQTVDEVKKCCLSKWKGEFDIDERLQTFSNEFSSWLSQIPEENRTTVLTLLQNLEYYSHNTTNKWLKNLHTQLIQKSSISDENTIYAFIKSEDGKTNSSNDYWTDYKFLNSLNLEICYEDIFAITDTQWQYIENIVFIDDFTGSGKSLIDELKKAPYRYANKNVYFITINVMLQAEENIRNFCKENNINIVIICAFKQSKMFESDVFENNSDAYKEIKMMSKDFKIPNCHIMGFHNSQSLVVFYNNTPNNTLGFIRYKTDKYNPIFPRRNHKKPFWQTIENTKNRNKTNYNNSKKRGFHE